MELIFERITEPNTHTPSGWNGTAISQKQRTGQKPMRMLTTFTLTLPDKVDAKWYAILEGKLAGIAANSLKHTIKIQDGSEFLREGYRRLQAEQGLNHTQLKLDPTHINFVRAIGSGILELKKEAKKKINGY